MSEFSDSKNRYGKRFGAIAMEKGFITLEQLVEALTAQIREEAASGSHRLIGTILFEQDALTGPELQQVVDEVLAARSN